MQALGAQPTVLAEVCSERRNGLVATMLAVCPDIHVLSDPLRGEMAASLCEIASTAGVGIEIDEARIPVPDDVRSACAFLGLDPLSVANEGKLIAIVAPEHVDAVLAAMRSHEFGREAAVIGTVVEDHRQIVVVRTSFGARRVVDLPLGEQLPRIC
jgi:hydrogenase expression/formation protein HypE